MTSKNFRRAFSAAALLAVVLSNTGRLAASNAVDAVTSFLDGRQAAYASFSGTVIEINEADGKRMITLENEEEALAVFAANDETYIPEGVAVEVGALLTGYYDTGRAMIMIYPPQYDAVCVISQKDGPAFTKLDRFDAENVSYDGLLRLNLAESTRIVDKNGDDWSGPLTDAGLMVTYAITTRSIPAITTPSEIVVLTDVEMKDATAQDPAESLVGLTVNGTKVGDIPLTMSDEGDVIVPLYLVCEGLGVSLTWDAEARQAVVDGTHAVVIGENAMIIEDRTYVPLSFFTDEMGLNASYALEDGIIISIK